MQPCMCPGPPQHGIASRCHPCCTTCSVHPQDKLKEQGEEIEEALAKDPLAGRHEIIRQEELKALAAAQLGPDGKPLGHKGAVHEWAAKNHLTLR